MIVWGQVGKHEKNQNEISTSRYCEMFPVKAQSLLTEMYSEPCQTSKMEHFAKLVNGFLTF